MDAKQTQLDPKLKEVYDRVMGTSAVPKAAKNTPSQTPSPSAPASPGVVAAPPSSPTVQMQTVEIPDTPLPTMTPQSTLETPAVAPVAPVTAQPEMTTMQATVATTLPAAQFTAPGVIPGTTDPTQKEKKLPGVLTLFIFFILIVFFLVYTFFWVKFFNLSVPF